MENEKRPCSGTFCPMNRNCDSRECKLYSECDYYSPLADTSGMDAVIDMAMKQFEIAESNRKKLEILFNSYVSQYMSIFGTLK